MVPPPAYPSRPAGNPVKLTSGEAYHLWDHLAARYDTVEITQIFESYVHDGDLSYVLQTGLRATLEKQIKRLEQEIALKQNTSSDRLRSMYITFLKEELNLFESLVKYGKVKGWLRAAPLLRKTNP